MAESNQIAVDGPGAPARAPPEVAGAPAGDAGVEARVAPPADPAPVASTRTVEIVASALLLAFAGVMGFDNWRTGMGWAPDGPKAGYFPFYLAVILGGASLYGLLEAIRKRGGTGKSFLDRDQLRRVLQVFVPTVLFCLATQLLGLYAASFLLVTGFMRFVGRIAWWKSAATGLVFALSIFLTFNLAFDVIMPKGLIEPLLRR